jgi:hypothetical protein
MPESVISRVNLLGAGQPELLVFADRKGRPIGDLQVDTEPIVPDGLAGVDGEEYSTVARETPNGRGTDNC